VNGSLFITISDVDADGSTTAALLTEVVRGTLDDFGLFAVIE